MGADAADEDLRQLQEQDRAAHNDKLKAALLISCNGRGAWPFLERNHDAEAIQLSAGPLPLTGFFAQGELRPVGKKNYIHGFTASIACFE